MRNGRPASCTSTSPCSLIFSILILEQPDDVARIVRRGDGDHGARLGDAMRGREHGAAAEAVADQDRRRAVHLAQMIGGGDQVVDVRGEMRVGEFAFAAAEAGEIEAQHGDAVDRQPLGDALGGEIVLAAGEAMREQREGRRLAERQVERRGELLALGVGEGEAFAAHDMLLVRFCPADPEVSGVGPRGTLAQNLLDLEGTL